MKIKLKIWRQANNETEGSLVSYSIDNIREDMSFFEVLDKLNNNLVSELLLFRATENQAINVSDVPALTILVHDKFQNLNALL